jgi:hypothetical protein
MMAVDWAGTSGLQLARFMKQQRRKIGPGSQGDQVETESGTQNHCW